MNKQYALIARNAEGKRLGNATVTEREPLAKHGYITPAMFTLCKSTLTVQHAASVDVVAWQEGTDIDTAPVILSAWIGERDLLQYSVAAEGHTS